MGRGRNPASGRYFPLEAFFYDEDFRAFCAYLNRRAERDGRGVRLVFNGDAFDFLRIELREGNTRSETFGPILTPATAAELMRDILTGHPQVVAGIADLLVAGHEVVFLPGNHDIEIQWECVRDELRGAVRRDLRARANVDVDEAMGLLIFEDWFHYVPGRVWIEHGCQYDPENSFRYLLRRGLSEEEDAVHLAEQDLPLGNFFQRYLYNDFGHITFIVPSTRANLRYMRWLLLNQPRLLFRVIFQHLPFVAQILRRAANVVATEARGKLRETHEAELDRLCKESGLGDKLREIESRKETRANVFVAVQNITKQMVKGVGLVLLIGLLSATLWSLGIQAINAWEVGVTLRTLVFVALNFTALAIAVGAILYTLLKAPPAPELPLRRAAEHIARTIEVPLVTFGHTHDEVVFPYDGGWYFNTGTWIAVFTHDELLPRERVQYTFLDIRGKEAQLRQWSPGRADSMPVVLLEERVPALEQIAPVS